MAAPAGYLVVAVESTLKRGAKERESQFEGEREREEREAETE